MIGFSILPPHLSSWISDPDENSTVINRLKNRAVSIPLLPLLSGNSMLSFSSWRVSAFCLEIPNGALLPLFGKREDAFGGNALFTGLLDAIASEHCYFD